MDRRACLVALVAACASIEAWAQAATGARRRIGVLAPSTRAREEVTLQPFFERMRQLGWVEGTNVDYDRVYGDDETRNLSRLAIDLVARKPDLIFAPPSPAAVAARTATRTIPIVFATGTDPVGIGLVASLAKPGGNVTGVLSVADSLTPKLIQMLHEVLPNAKRLGFLSEPNDPRARIDLAALRKPASALGLSVVVADVANPSALGLAVSRLADEKVDAVVTSTALLFNLRDTLLQLTNARRLPVTGHRAEMADAGAIFTYGAALPDQMREAAAIVDKVLRGATPADLPVQQPTKFELVVNVKAASLLGIKIPQGLLLRADRVIE